MILAGLVLWPLWVVPCGFIAYALLLRLTLSPPKPRGPLADPRSHVRIHKPAFSNAEIIIIHNDHLGDPDDDD